MISADRLRWHMAELAPWQNEAHARLPDGNHGAWLLPFAMEATKAAAGRYPELPWACPRMTRKPPKLTS